MIIIKEVRQVASPRTVLQLLFLQTDLGSGSVALQMKTKDVKPCASIMALNCNGAHFMLHREVTSYSTRTITNEIKGCRKAAPGKQVVEKIVECALP
jgi:hypothetical protein